MANLRFLLGFIPKTSVVEEKENALIKEYAEFQAYEASGEPARFQELQKECTSAAFKESVARIRGQKFSQTEEFKKQQEYAQIKKSAPCKTREWDSVLLPRYVVLQRLPSFKNLHTSLTAFSVPTVSVVKTASPFLSNRVSHERSLRFSDPLLI